MQKQKIEEAKTKQLVEKNGESQKEDVVEELYEKDEIAKTYLSIDSMNIDDNMKIEAKEKIKAKIQQARKERAAMVLEDPQVQQEQKQLEKQIEQEKLKKEQELEEFWD